LGIFFDHSLQDYNIQLEMVLNEHKASDYMDDDKNNDLDT